VRQFELTNNMRRTARDNGINRSTLRNWVKYKRVLQNVGQKSMFFLTQVSNNYGIILFFKQLNGPIGQRNERHFSASQRSHNQRSLHSGQGEEDCSYLTTITV